MHTPTMDKRTTGPLSPTERGRLAVLVRQLERTYPTLDRWQQRHVTALVSNLLVVYGRPTVEEVA
jgi:hypothetical protein